MVYAIAAICVSLMVIVLSGKPIRVEIIHSVGGQPTPVMIPVETPASAEKAKEEQAQADAALDVMAYVNEVFHNVKPEVPSK